MRHLRIGNAKMIRGISGGEARRVSIGTSLVQLTKPGLLCLDEPTTGLDSAIGNDILRMIKRCASRGWTVFGTIHNPSALMMNNIDGLVLVVSSRVIWFGCYDPERMKEDFNAQGFDAPGGAHGSAACIVEYLLEVVGGGSKGAREDVIAKAMAACEASETCAANRAKAIDFVRSETGGLGSASCAAWRRPKSLTKDAQSHMIQFNKACFANGVWNEVGILLAFSFKAMKRDYMFILNRLGICVVEAVFFATFWANKSLDMEGLVATITVMFAVPVGLSVPFCLFIPHLVQERASFVREQHEGCYRVLSYCAKIFVKEFTIIGVGAMLFTLIIYFAIGTFPMTAEAFFFYFLNTWTIALSSVLAATAAANLSRSMETGLLVANVYYLWNILVMGFIATYDSMPKFYGWTYYISFMQYGFSGYIINQFQDGEWNMCSELSGGISLDAILDDLTNGGTVHGILTRALDNLQGTMEDATKFSFPFDFSDAYCLDTEGQYKGNETQIPYYLEEILPDAHTLKGFATLLPSLLGGGGGSDLLAGGPGRQACNDLCLPVPGSKLIQQYDLDPNSSRWQFLGMGILFVFVVS